MGKERVGHVHCSLAPKTGQAINGVLATGLGEGPRPPLAASRPPPLLTICSSSPATSPPATGHSKPGRPPPPTQVSPPDQRRRPPPPLVLDWRLVEIHPDLSSLAVDFSRDLGGLTEPPMPQVKAKVSAVAATSAGTSAVAAAAAPPPRRWEGVDPALERMVLRACLDQAPERRRVREAFKDVQLSIDHCLFKGQYSGIGTKESYEVNSRGVEIFSKCWFPENHCMKAIVCLCHGYGDTCTFFLDGIAKKIASAGYGVFALDYPGFGLSEGLHGYIPSFDTLVDNVAEHFAKVKGQSEHRGLPSFLFGQSMGGAVALKVHFKQPNEWNGAILVAPMCKIADDVVPPWPVQQVLIFLARLHPKGKLVPQKDLAELAFKEKKKQEQCSYNVIAYKDKPRLRTAVEMLRTTQDIESRLEEVSLPIIILHGEADLVTDPAVSKALYEKAKSSDKTLRLYKDAWHSILEGEPDETIFQVLDDIISWLDQHSEKEVSSS